MKHSPKAARSSEESAPAVRAGPTYRARPRRREYLIEVATEEICRESGFGLTLDRVLAEMAESHAARLASGRYELDGLDDPRDGDDQVIWEGSSVVAVLRVDVEGRLEVVRFDGPDSAPGGSVLAVLTTDPPPSTIDTADGGRDPRPRE